MADAAVVAECDGSFECPAIGHDEDTDCYSVTCVPPKCEQHGGEIIRCRECAANPPQGWQLVECDQGHPVMWMPDDEWCYPPGCAYCSYDAFAAGHRECEHAGHGRWRRWRLTHKLELWAYSMGIVAGGGTRHGGGCRGCLIGPRWRGKRPYILGLQREEWSCLRRGHRRRDVYGWCGVCAPSPCCGSTGYEHAETCPEGAQ